MTRKTVNNFVVFSQLTVKLSSLDQWKCLSNKNTVKYVWRTFTSNFDEKGDQWTSGELYQHRLRLLSVTVLYGHLSIAVTCFSFHGASIKKKKREEKGFLPVSWLTASLTITWNEKGTGYESVMASKGESINKNNNYLSFTWIGSLRDEEKSFLLFLWKHIFGMPHIDTGHLLGTKIRTKEKKKCERNDLSIFVTAITLQTLGKGSHASISRSSDHTWYSVSFFLFQSHLTARVSSSSSTPPSLFFSFSSLHCLSLSTPCLPSTEWCSRWDNSVTQDTKTQSVSYTNFQHLSSFTMNTEKEEEEAWLSPSYRSIIRHTKCQALRRKKMLMKRRHCEIVKQLEQRKKRENAFNRREYGVNYVDFWK